MNIKIQAEYVLRHFWLTFYNTLLHSTNWGITYVLTKSFVGFKIPTTRGFWNLLMGYRWSSNSSQVWGKTEIKDCLDTSEYFKRHHLYIKSSFFSSSFESLEPNRRYLKTALDFVFNPFVGTFLIKHRKNCECCPVSQLIVR